MAEGDVAGWVIEKPGSDTAHPIYLGVHLGEFKWVGEDWYALRFAAQHDALVFEQALGKIQPDLFFPRTSIGETRLAEHIWSGSGGHCLVMDNP